MPDVANDCKKSEVSINTQFFKKKERKSEKDFMAVIMVQA